MKSLVKQLILMSIGGLLYVILELIWRGRSHWTMFIVGGICFLCIGAINEVIPWEMPIWQQGIIGSIIVTNIEFISGCIINLWLGLAVWDYSNVPFNLLGQICLPFIFIWFFISLIAIVIDDYLRYLIFNEEKPNYRLTIKY